MLNSLILVLKVWIKYFHFIAFQVRKRNILGDRVDEMKWLLEVSCEQTAITNSVTRNAILSAIYSGYCEGCTFLASNYWSRREDVSEDYTKLTLTARLAMVGLPALYTLCHLAIWKPLPSAYETLTADSDTLSDLLLGVNNGNCCYFCSCSSLCCSWWRLEVTGFNQGIYAEVRITPLSVAMLGRCKQLHCGHKRRKSCFWFTRDVSWPMSTVFWVVTPCSTVQVPRRFLGTCGIRLQGRR
jgi:hypothetical protein